MGTPERRPAILGWVVVLTLGLASVPLFAALGLPSPAMFAALFACILNALVDAGPDLRLPTLGSVIGQGLVGTSMGLLLDTATMQEVARHWASISLVTLSTLLLSILVGVLFARLGHLSAPTGVFSLVAGGASGITAISRELGADDRVVTVVQYLRVVLVLVGMPLVTKFVFHPPTGARTAGSDGTHGSLVLNVAFVVLSIVLGALLARLAHIPAGAMLGPLLVSAVINLTAPVGVVEVPKLALQAGYFLIGLQVGVRFTKASLRSIQHLLPMAISLIVLVIVGTAGFGQLLAVATHRPSLDCYLATTPGGIYAVLAVAADSGADVTFVLSVQVIRLLLMLLSAPLIASILRRLPPGHPDAEDVD